MSITCLTGVVLALESLLGGQVATNDDVQHDLSLRLEPGQIWRQAIQCEADLSFDDGSNQGWKFACALRFECTSLTESGDFEVDAKFIEWRMLWDRGPFSMEWKNGRFHVDGDSEEDSESETESCKAVWRAWSDGLRDADLRLRFTRDGRLTDLRGADGLWRTVEEALSGADDLPKEFAHLYGMEGLERALAVVNFALNAPRPTDPAAVGTTWVDQAWLPDFPSVTGLVNRHYRVSEFIRERRHRLGVVSLQPSLSWTEEGTLQAPAPAKVDQRGNRVEISVDNGLMYRFECDLTSLARPASLPEVEAFYRITAQLRD